MKRIRIADFKARLSEHLRYVRRGNDVTILDRDTPVARVVPWEDAAGLVIREPRGQRPLHEVPLPEPLKLHNDPVTLLLDERQADR